MFTVEVMKGAVVKESRKTGEIQSVKSGKFCKLRIIGHEKDTRCIMCTSESARILFADFGQALRFVEDNMASCIRDVDPGRVLQEKPLKFFGDARFSILTTVACRVYHASMALACMETIISKKMCSSTHEYWMKGCITCPFHRTALLLRMYIVCHMDLLAACTHTVNGAAPSDEYLCERKNFGYQLSIYEKTYPYGTRCAGTFSACLPPLVGLLDHVLWFSKKQQHKWPPLQCLQKVCPHKYMQRGWDAPLKKSCETNKAMTYITAALITCSFFGGYSHCIHFPEIKFATSMWHCLKNNTCDTVISFVNTFPNYVLFAWKEAVVWMIQLKPDLLEHVKQKYTWDKFSCETLRAMNRAREYMARSREDDDHGFVPDMCHVDTFLKMFREKVQIPNSRRVLKIPFNVLFCRYMDFILRQILRVLMKDSDEGTIPLEFFCDESISAVPYVYEACKYRSDLTIDPWQSDIKENALGNRVLLNKSFSMENVVKISEVPSRIKAWILHVQRMYEDNLLADTTAKTWLGAGIKELDDGEFLSLHRALAYSCTSGMVAILNMDKRTDFKNLMLIKPEDRPLYICTCCGRIGASVSNLPKGQNSTPAELMLRTDMQVTQRRLQQQQQKPETVTRGSKKKQTKKKDKICSRGLKDVTYSFRWNSVFCNKKMKKSVTRRGGEMWNPMKIASISNSECRRIDRDVFKTQNSTKQPVTHVLKRVYAQLDEESRTAKSAGSAFLGGEEGEDDDDEDGNVSENSDTSGEDSDDGTVYIESIVGVPVKHANVGNPDELQTTDSLPSDNVMINQEQVALGGFAAANEIQKRVRKKETVPKHELDKVLLRTCGKIPMQCLDRRGVMIRVGKKVVCTCCSCGMLAEVWQKSCIVLGKPLCTACRTVAIAKIMRERAEKTTAMEPNKTCFVCGRMKRDTSRGITITTTIVFNDTKAVEGAPYYQLVKLTVCQRHPKNNVMIDGITTETSLQFPSLKEAMEKAVLDRANSNVARGSNSYMDPGLYNSKSLGTRKYTYPTPNQPQGREKRRISETEMRVTEKMRKMKRHAREYKAKKQQTTRVKV